MTHSRIKGAASTPHREATAVAHRVLDAGGNAIDAAVAAAAMLTVVYPNQCTVGGDAIALVGDANGNIEMVNGSGRAPRAMSDATLYGEVPVVGAGSITVPGAVSTWEQLFQLGGKQPLAQVLGPAISAASYGIDVAPGVARDLHRERDLLWGDEGARALFFNGDRVLRAGDRLVNSRLAQTLDTIAQSGSAALYGGDLARALVPTLRALGSELTVEDFAAHRVERGEHESAMLGGDEYLSSTGNTQGVFFLLGLRVLDALARRSGRVLDALGDDASLVAKVLALTARLRDAHLGDPAFASITPPDWTSPEIIDALCAAVLGETAVPDVLLTPVAPRPSGDTVAVVVADSEGRWVSLIQSAFHAFGSGVVDPATGLLFHNRGASFTTGDGASALRPGARPPHTLMPVLVRREGRLIGAHGTMGGRAQPQVHTHLALNLALGLDSARAVRRPRWIVGQMEAGPRDADEARTVAWEADAPVKLASDLAEGGFLTRTLAVLDDEVGHLQVVRNPEGEAFEVGSDPRADGVSE